MMKQYINNQKGFSLIIAIVILLIFGVLAAMLTSLVTTDSDIAMYQARSGEALYIANAGQQYLMKQNYPPARVTPQINVVGSSGFTSDPPAALSSGIDNIAIIIPASCLDKGATVDCSTIFPSSGRILIESELISYTGVGASSFTGATRGVGNSLAASHAINRGIYHAAALTANVTNAATTIPVSSTTGFMIPGTIKIDQEFLYCEGTVGGFSICTRGTQGSQAMAHNSGATAIQITATVTGIVPTGIIGDAKRVLRAQTEKYLDGWGVGGAVPITANLNSVFCISTANCWAVGAGGIIIHYDGLAWSTVASPTAQDLNEVHCVSATDCWAVGDLPNVAGESCNQFTPNILHYDGISWSCRNTGLNNNNRMNINSVFAVSGTDVWVVGDFNNRAGQSCAANTPTIFHWDGTNWSCPSTGDPDDRMNLNSVFAVSDTDVWVVGDTTNRNNATCADNSPTIFRWNNPLPNQWNCVNTNNSNDRMNLNSIYMLDVNGDGDVSDPVDQGWVVGDFNNRAGQTCTANTPTIFRWNGSSWSCANTNDSDDRMNLNSVFALSATDVWVVGNTTNRNNGTCTPNGAPTIFHGTGGPPVNWSCANTGAQAEDYNSAYCIAGNDCWTVGTNGAILHWNGAAWSAPPSPPPALLRWNGINWDRVSTPVGLAQNLNSISMLDIDLNGFSEDGWGVGDRIANTTSGWTFLRWNSPTAGIWNQITVTTAVNAQNLQSVYMLSATDGWAVGNRIANTTNGWTFLRWNSPTAGTWNQITVTTAANAQNLNSVSMLSATDGWSVGNRIGAGNNQWTFLKWTGSWSQFIATTGVAAQNLNSVFMLSTTDGWAVGNRRGCANPGLTILRWNGASWSCPAGLPVVDQNLNSVYMISTTDGWAVGNRRGCANPGLTILRWNGASWSCPAGLPVVDQNLNSVYCNSSTDCWAKGNTGTILHWDGTNWSQYPSPTANALNEVFLIRPQNFLRLADWQEVY